MSVDAGTSRTVQALLDERLVTEDEVAPATSAAERTGRTDRLLGAHV